MPVGTGKRRRPSLPGQPRDPAALVMSDHLRYDFPDLSACLSASRPVSLALHGLDVDVLVLPFPVFRRLASR